MKKISIIVILASSLLFAGSLSSDEITKMISNIKKERVGIALNKLENTANPFIIRKKEEKKKEEVKKEVKKVVKSVKKKVVRPVYHEAVYNLHAILNHAAFINKKWYKKGDKLGRYRITYIGKKSVKLSSKSGGKVLSMKKRKNKFIKLNEGNK